MTDRQKAAAALAKLRDKLRRSNTVTDGEARLLVAVLTSTVDEMSKTAKVQP